MFCNFLNFSTAPNKVAAVWACRESVERASGERRESRGNNRKQRNRCGAECVPSAGNYGGWRLVATIVVDIAVDISSFKFAGVLKLFGAVRWLRFAWFEAVRLLLWAKQLRTAVVYKQNTRHCRIQSTAEPKPLRKTNRYDAVLRELSGRSLSVWYLPGENVINLQSFPIKRKKEREANVQISCVRTVRRNQNPRHTNWSLETLLEREIGSLTKSCPVDSSKLHEPLVKSSSRIFSRVSRCLWHRQIGQSLSARPLISGYIR